MALYFNGSSVVKGGAEYIELTQAEYDALTTAEKNNGIMYFITDTNGDGQDFQPVIYSEDEREIGVWIDGKPLYEKTLNLNVTVSGDEFDISDLDVDSMIQVIGFIRQTDGNNPSVPYCSSSVDYALPYYSFSDNSIHTIYEGSYNQTIWTVTIRYTKTTDTAGSGQWTPQGVPAVHYSTDEQIVGTWVDGKTLYQKTLEFQAPSTRDYTQQSLGVSVDYVTVIDSAVIKNNQIGILTGDYDGSPANDEWQGFLNKSNNTFCYRVGATYLNANCYLTIRYTKSST